MSNVSKSREIATELRVLKYSGQRNISIDVAILLAELNTQLVESLARRDARLDEVSADLGGIVDRFTERMRGF